MPAADANGLYIQICRLLIESGDWDVIRSVMRAKLNEAGWIDETHHKSKELARKMDTLTYQSLYDEISSVSTATIPLSVRKDTMTLIRQTVEKQIES